MKSGGKSVSLCEYMHFEMRIVPYILLSVLPFISCGPNAARSGKAKTAPALEQPAEPTRYTYIVRNVYPHLAESYTQGLQFIDGQLWEGTGEYGHSVLQRVDLETGKADVKVRLPRSEFGEGITLFGDRIYQLTWMNNTAHVYDRKTFEKITNFRYTGEGWGLTTDGVKLYMSDGTANIRVIDPATFRREKDIPVTYKGQPVEMLNELEWIDGRIWANVYTTNQIVLIDPASGVVEGVVDLTGLLPDADRTPETDVLNGIAYDVATGRIFVTGKRWDKLFEIEIVNQ